MIGERVRQARLAAGLTLDELSERLAIEGQQITKAGLSKYEMNRSTPKAGMLPKLAAALGVKPSYFFQTLTSQIDWLPYFHSPRLARAQMNSFAAIASEVIEGQIWLQGILAPHEKPRFPEPARVKTEADAEAAAALLRKTWKIGSAPVASVTQAIEDHGGIVVCRDFGDGFDALSGWADDSVPVFVVNSQSPRSERRYFLALELGRLLTDCRGLTSKRCRQVVQYFADAFLVPADALRRELGARRRHIDLEEIKRLNPKYGLGWPTHWLRRLESAAIIEESHGRTVARKATAEHRLRDQAASEEQRERNFVELGGASAYEFPGEEIPLRLGQLVRRARAENVITEERAAELFVTWEEPVEGRTSDATTSLRPSEVLKLPREERDRILREAAADLEQEYKTNSDLVGFEAFGDKDLLVSGASGDD
jgi:transcriptional regulator with XRE-family HTH domain